jgi:hypothetical protein
LTLSLINNRITTANELLGLITFALIKTQRNYCENFSASLPGPNQHHPLLVEVSVRQPPNPCRYLHCPSHPNQVHQGLPPNTRVLTTEDSNGAIQIDHTFGTTKSAANKYFLCSTTFMKQTPDGYWAKSPIEPPSSQQLRNPPLQPTGTTTPSSNCSLGLPRTFLPQPGPSTSHLVPSGVS